MKLNAYIQTSFTDDISIYLSNHDVDSSSIIELIYKWLSDSIVTVITNQDEFPHEDYFNAYVCSELVEKFYGVLPEKLLKIPLTTLTVEFHADIVGHFFMLSKLVFNLLTNINIESKNVLNLQFKDLTWGYMQLSVEIEDNKDPYFKSEIDRLIFTLLHMDGKSRNDALGIKRVHYKDKQKAKQWYKSLANKLHPDKCNHPMASKAFSKLKERYRLVTGDWG